jgi:hypothetical protein
MQHAMAAGVYVVLRILSDVVLAYLLRGIQY